MCLSDEGSVSRPSVASDGSSVENVPFLGMTDVTFGMIVNVNEMNSPGYFVCSIYLWYKRLAHLTVKNIEKNEI